MFKDFFTKREAKIRDTSRVNNAGMTFIELIVVLGIFAAVAATVLFNYRGFSNNVSLQNLAQEVALQIKRAQTDAVSGKTPALSVVQLPNINNLLSLDWTPSYGVAFDKEEYPGSLFFYFNKDVGSSSEIKLDFLDIENGSYSSPCGNFQTSGCLEELLLPANVVIDMICFDFTTIVPQGDCSDADGVEGDTAHISFTRPRGNASIMEFDDGDYNGNVFVRLTTVDGGKRYIAVWESGYISIK